MEYDFPLFVFANAFEATEVRAGFALNEVLNVAWSCFVFEISVDVNELVLIGFKQCRSPIWPGRPDCPGVVIDEDADGPVPTIEHRLECLPASFLFVFFAMTVDISIERPAIKFLTQKFSF